jgi:hypothetical protein
MKRNGFSDEKIGLTIRLDYIAADVREQQGKGVYQEGECPPELYLQIESLIASGAMIPDMSSLWNILVKKNDFDLVRECIKNHLLQSDSIESWDNAERFKFFTLTQLISHNTPLDVIQLYVKQRNIDFQRYPYNWLIDRPKNEIWLMEYYPLFRALKSRSSANMRTDIVEYLLNNGINPTVTVGILGEYVPPTHRQVVERASGGRGEVDSYYIQTPGYYEDASNSMTMYTDKDDPVKPLLAKSIEIWKKKMDILAKYDYAGDFSEGLAQVKLGLKWGFIDKTGKEVIPLKYDSAKWFSEGLAKVELGGKRGFIDKTGKEVIPLKYYVAMWFSEGLAKAELGGKVGFIDKTGKEVIPLKYDYDTGDFSEGLAKVELGGKYGFIDKTGKEVIPLKYDYVTWFSEGLATVKLGGKWGFIDKTGKEVIPLKYDYADNFSEGLACVRLVDKVGFIDKTGKEVIPSKYDSVGNFSEGLADVKLGGKYGFIDKTGKEVIPLKYDHAEIFSEGLAKVRLGFKWGQVGFIDKTGKEVIPLKYDYAGSFSEGLASVKLGFKWGFIDKTGKER